jgi:hypothetical protein
VSYPLSLFYKLLFGTMPVGHYVSVWSGKSKLSRHVAGGPDGFDRFQAAVDSFPSSHDVYVGIAGRRPGLGASARGRVSECIGIPAFWLDVDRADDSQAHKAKNLPRTLEDLVWLIEGRAAPYNEPSLIVDSGHGWHVYWCWREYHGFAEKGRDPAFANRASQAWQDFYIQRAKERGWHVDQTGNLDRVLRVPGTLNHKSDPPAPVEILAYLP